MPEALELVEDDEVGFERVDTAFRQPLAELTDEVVAPGSGRGFVVGITVDEGWGELVKAFSSTQVEEVLLELFHELIVEGRAR